jgi:hypothetical protein
MMGIDVTELVKQLMESQEQFRLVHKTHEELKDRTNLRFELKHEIKQMEDEKTQLVSKIGKLQRKVEQLVCDIAQVELIEYSRTMRYGWKPLDVCVWNKTRNMISRKSMPVGYP